MCSSTFDALIGHVRFDERGWETGRRFGVSARAHPRLYKLLLPRQSLPPGRVYALDVLGSFTFGDGSPFLSAKIDVTVTSSAILTTALAVVRCCPKEPGSV